MTNHASQELLQQETISLIKREYLNSELPWFIGFSGGKDSSALVKLVFTALGELSNRKKSVTLIYVDTGVDIPIIQSLVKETLEGMVQEAQKSDIPIQVQFAYPKPEDRYFVKVIGRGYPPPTNKFRWCTRRLRINPVKEVLRTHGSEKKLILLGVRKGESVTRDKIIAKHEISDSHYYRQSGDSDSLIFSPIIDYSIKDVWSALTLLDQPKSINVIRLYELYTEASGECPSIRDPNGTPCGKGRFGCWTCTVVRKDKAVTSMVNEGYKSLAPLLGFRNWLVSIRDHPDYRCKKRRNGQSGLGPFRIDARQEILDELLRVQSLSGYELIHDEEISLIMKFWEQDRNSLKYQED
jgi:DNA sulfur modification protein DndC